MSETLHLPCWPQQFCRSTSIILPKKRDFLQSTTCRTGAMPFQSARCSLQLWDRFWEPLQMSRIWRKTFELFFCSESSVVRCSVSFRHGFSFWLSLFWQIQGIQPVWFLWCHADRRDWAQTHGYRFFSRICLGIHRKLRPFYDWARIRFIRFKIRHFASESHDDCICHHCFLVAFNDASVIKSISAALLCRKNGKMISSSLRRLTTTIKNVCRNKKFLRSFWHIFLHRRGLYGYRYGNRIWPSAWSWQQRSFACAARHPDCSIPISADFKWIG